jgi:hypothetical protein
MKVINTDPLAKQGATDGQADANKEGDDLEMIGGTSEDDFSEAIALIRYLTFQNMAKYLERKSCYSETSHCLRDMDHCL